MRLDRRRLLPGRIDVDRRHAGRLQSQSTAIEWLGLNCGQHPMLTLGDAPLVSIHYLPQPVAGEADR